MRAKLAREFVLASLASMAQYTAISNEHLALLEASNQHPVCQIPVRTQTRKGRSHGNHVQTV